MHLLLEEYLFNGNHRDIKLMWEMFIANTLIILFNNLVPKFFGKPFPFRHNNDLVTRRLAHNCTLWLRCTGVNFSLEHVGNFRILLNKLETFYFLWRYETEIFSHSVVNTFFVFKYFLIYIFIFIGKLMVLFIISMVIFIYIKYSTHVYYKFLICISM